jgi:hypothetical protein
MHVSSILAKLGVTNRGCAPASPQRLIGARQGKAARARRD